MILKMERSVYNRQGKKTVLPKITKVVWPNGILPQETKKPFNIQVTIENEGPLRMLAVIAKNPITGSLVVNAIHYSGKTFVARILEVGGPTMSLTDEAGNDVTFGCGPWLAHL